nr:RNA-directed DNA polymerase, eukaryota [Tanacetum cinerariifolium]
MVRNTSTTQDTNGWCWKFKNNKQDLSIPLRNQFHKEVEKIASSFYLTNFHDYVDAKRLWVECQSYGRIVDSFIANKRSKAGKMFGFVRFLGVKNEEQLALSLASIWIGSYHLFVYVARFNRQEKNEAFSKNNGDKTTNYIPSQKADHVGSSQNKKSYASSLNGDRDSKVEKQVTAIKGNTLSNVPLTPSLITPALVLDDSCTLLTKEEFLDVKLTYLGGMWVMIELDNEATKLKLLQHIGVNSWFHILQVAIHNFVSDERVVWVDIEGVPLNVWSRETSLKLFLKSYLHGVIYMDPNLSDHKESEYISDDESLHISNDESLHGAKNNSEKVVEQQSKDPFCIYDVLNKKPKGVAQDLDSSLSHPPGFIPEVSRQENDHTGVDLNTEIDNVNSPLVHTKVMNNSQKVHGNVTSNGESAFNYSHNAHNGGTILEVLDDMNRAGQSMGYAMEGCMNDSAGSSGGILCVWEATIFKKDYATGSDNFIAIYGTWISNNSKTIVMGDFNEVRSIDERFGSMVNQSSSRLFNQFITSSGLVDVKLEGYTFTWAHPLATKMSKLDRFLVSEGIISLFTSIMALCLDRHLSDHRPILLREIHTNYGLIPFRFYHSWFKWDRFDVMVEQAYNFFSHSDTNGLIRFKKKLQDLKKNIRSWIKDNKLEQSGAINSIKEDLIDIDKNLDSGNVSDEILLKRMELTRQLHDINQMEARDYFRIVARISLQVQTGIRLNSLGDVGGSLALISVRLLNVSLKVGLFRREMFYKLLVSALTGASGFEALLVPQWLRSWLIGALLLNSFFCGLKQGHPLASYLFILIIESLHISFSRATSDGLFKGIQIQGSMAISHLFCADDAVFIEERSDSNLDNIVKILKCFFLASGLKINIQKSQVLGVGVPRNIVNQAASLIGCAVMQNPFRYLGVMVGDSMSRKLAWADTVQKLRSWSSKWKVKTLSIGGRLTLLKSVLGASPLYNM